MLESITIERMEGGVAVTVEGTPADIMLDLTIITMEVYTAFLKGGMPEYMAKVIIKSAMETALLTNPELHIKETEAVQEIINDLRSIREEVDEHETENDSEEC